MTRKWYVFLLFPLLIGTSSGSDNSTRIEGFVTTDLAAPLPAVAISADSRDWNMHVTVTSDVSGHYAIENLHAGAYSMWAEARGYGCILISRIVVEYGKTTRQDFNFTTTHKEPGKRLSVESCKPEKHPAKP